MVVPTEVRVHDMQDLYSRAVWQFYKHNTLSGGEYFINDPFYADQEFSEVFIGAFEPEYYGMLSSGDSITFYLMFEYGATPQDQPYYTGVTFIDGSDQVGLNINQRFGFFYPENYKDEEFREVLDKMQAELGTSISCLFSTVNN